MAIDALRVAPVPCSGQGLIDVEAGESAAVVVVRDPRTAVAALAQAWLSRHFARDPQPEGWWGEPWAFDLIPDWRELIGRPLTEICARQWLTLMIDALSQQPKATVVTFEELASDPRACETRLTALRGVPTRVALAEPVDPFALAFDRGEVLVGLEANADLLEHYVQLVESAGITSYRQPLPESSQDAVDGRRSSVGTEFHASYSTTLAELLHQAAASLIITTYKAGQIIIARTEDGAALDTHMSPMPRPMGVAVSGNRLAIGAAESVHAYVRHDAGHRVAQLPIPDAVYVPKSICVTGDVAIHDMGWDADGTLWFVNTRFSCLSTLDLNSSFNVRWKPWWITQIAAEDRCHLNGLALVDGRPRYVTALAQTDEMGGWREHKGTSGLIIDITTNQVIADSLSMPHSPRWHDGCLWFLQSGHGTLNVLDVDTGHHRVVATLPGFTRGLAFIGHYALVGLSQVRESVFTGLPVTESADERNCGVWVVDTHDGATVGFLRFTGTVTEIFDVQVLGARWPHFDAGGELTAGSFTLDPQVLALLHQAGHDPLTDPSAKGDLT